MKGKVVLTAFPFSEDASILKARPAICLTDVIGFNNEVIVAYITSRAEVESLDSDIIIHDFENYGLKKLSKIKLHKLATITIDLIKTKLGTLNDSYIDEIDTNLQKLFEI